MSREIMGGLYAQQEEIDAVVMAVRSQFPDSADHVEYRGVFLRSVSSVMAFAYDRSSVSKQIMESDDTYDALERLRQVMYVPGAGTWWSVQMTMRFDGHTQWRFNYDDEPQWPGFPPPPISWVDDQHFFPIDEDKQPEWLKKHLAEGVAELKKYGKKSYPEWLVEEIAAGNKPAWL